MKFVSLLSLFSLISIPSLVNASHLHISSNHVTEVIKYDAQVSTASFSKKLLKGKLDGKKEYNLLHELINQIQYKQLTYGPTTIIENSDTVISAARRVTNLWVPVSVNTDAGVKYLFTAKVLCITERWHQSARYGGYYYNPECSIQGIAQSL